MEQILFALLRHVNRSGILFLSLILSLGTAKAQDSLDLVKISGATNVDALKNYSIFLKNNAELKKSQAYEAALQKGWMTTKTGEDGSGVGLKELDKTGKPVYLYTGNLNSAKTVSSNKVWTGGGLGFNLTGAGITLREWDQSQVRTTHQELTGRVVIGDASVGLSAHSTHVAGTMIATGIDANAHGMSKLANLRDFDWDFDYVEMASEAAAGMLLSNHSYVYVTGWYNAGSWYWYGDTIISRYEDSYFGFYGDDARIVDSIAFNAPYYLVCRAAGNDRGEGPATQPVTHYVWNGTTWITASTIRNNDGMPSGYGCITNGFGTCKNTMTVGAVSAIPAGYSSPGDVVHAGFSCTGPTDDGRIKPDLVADGVGLYSTYSSANNAYASMTGTSMATPSCAGALCLLQEHYHNLHGIYMRSATLKGLAIHTADEAGSYPGPDYKFGWGLLNSAKAATLLSNTTTAKVKELTLTNGTTYTLNPKTNGTEALRATICWTDPPGTPPPPSLNPPNIMLVNDLDLRIDGQAYKPWILDPANPTNDATTGDNIRDNTEQVYIASITAGCHTLTVTHKGILTGGSQAFSLIVSGITVYPDFVAGPASGNQAICASATPALLSATPPTGGNPPYTYQWQNSTDSINFTNIPGANGLTYQPGPLTVKTFYRQVQSAAGSCDNSNTNILRIVVNPVPVPAITGNTNLCVNTGFYTYTTEPGMTNYSWSATPGGSIAAGLGTNVIQVTWNASGAQSVSVNYFNTFGCPAQSATVLPVQVNTVPPAAGNITGIPIVCQGDSGLIYSLTPVANATAYIWTLPTGAEIVSGNLTNSITVKYSGTALSGNYTVAANNICGNGTSSPPYPVTVNPTPPAPVIAQQGDTLGSDAPAGNQWYGPGGLVSGATGQNYTPGQNGNYYDIVTLNGCSSDPSNTINFILTGTGNSAGTIPRIFPNPAGNTLHVELFLEHSSGISLNLMNITGSAVKTIDYGIHARGPVKLILDCTDLKGGIYFLKVTTESGSFVHKIILEK
ncbi:MAG: S8 family serine peptidase [Bacteroidetes bacterium]|nr:S8 family serine peptidase [Bacteroidota bacterium]